MEYKKFNNAIEKAENLSEDTQRVKQSENSPQTEQEKRLARMKEVEEQRARVRARQEEIRRKKQERIAQMATNQGEEGLLSTHESGNNSHGGGGGNDLGGNRKKRSIGGWLAAVVALGCVCLVLSSILIYNVFMKGGGEKMLSNAYARSFYSLVGYVDNMDVNLSKLVTSNDNSKRQKILCDLMVQANLAEADLSTLPIETNSKQSTEKFINQVGDYCKYLNNKLIDGDSLSKEDISTLNEMRKINGNLRNKLKTLENDLGGEFDFITLLSGEENPVLNSFNELEYHSLDYPKMIYDGPFADELGENEKSSQKSPQNPISEEQAIKVFESCFADYNPTEISVTGKAESKDFSVFNLEAKIDEESVFAQITADGKLIMFDVYKKSNSVAHTRDQCIDNALNFLNNCGYKSIKAVWSSQGKDNVLYVNFASTDEKGQIVMYADLIKVGVCMDSGKVCDMDAHLYLKNHKQRQIPEVKFRVEEAEKMISPNVEVEASRLAIIPLSNNKERLAYEFYGKSSEGTFYIYVDAQTGKELEIFKVVGTDDGDLLL